MGNRNETILEIFLQRVRRYYADDVALVFTYGSTVTGGANEKSNLDMAFIPRTKRGHELAMTFILDGVGYDFFPISWTQLERIASFDDPKTSLIADSLVVYSGAHEYEERFEQLRGWIMDTMDFPLRMPMVEKARGLLDRAMVNCASMQIATELGPVRTYSGGTVYYLMETVATLNNRFFHKGMKHWPDELRAMKQLPEDFFDLYAEVVDAREADEIKQKTWVLLAAVEALFSRLRTSIMEKKLPQEVLVGTYEEIFCTWRNKISAACTDGDASLAFLAATCLQRFVNAKSDESGLRNFDLMRHFQADDLRGFWAASEQLEKQYLAEMERLDVPIRRFASLDAYRSAMLK